MFIFACELYRGMDRPEESVADVLQALRQTLAYQDDIIATSDDGAAAGVATQAKETCITLITDVLDCSQDDIVDGIYLKLRATAASVPPSVRPPARLPPCRSN